MKYILLESGIVLGYQLAYYYYQIKEADSSRSKQRFKRLEDCFR